MYDTFHLSLKCILWNLHGRNHRITGLYDTLWVNFKLLYSWHLKEDIIFLRQELCPIICKLFYTNAYRGTLILEGQITLLWEWVLKHRLWMTVVLHMPLGRYTLAGSGPWSRAEADRWPKDPRRKRIKEMEEKRWQGRRINYVKVRKWN